MNKYIKSIRVEENYTMSLTINDNGSYTISDIHNGYYVYKTYYFYTMMEAQIMFKEYLTTL